MRRRYPYHHRLPGKNGDIECPLPCHSRAQRRIGTTGGFNPDPKNVDQLDDYLAQSQKQGRVRMGILTYGKY